MSDIKALLKDARKHIDDKNYNNAQECCKNILRKDKQNYFGLVLLGKSLQDSDQAPLAYQKAITVKSDHPLAWQGLANYYETKDDENGKSKLFSIYKELLNLQIDEEKALEIIGRLGQLGCSLKSHEAISILANYWLKDLNNNLKKATETQLIELLMADVPCKEKDTPKILTILNQLHANEPSELLELLLCKVIMQKSNLSSAVEEVIQLNFFSTNVVVREWLCKQMCKKYMENMSFSDIIIANYIDTVTEGITNSKYPDLLKSMICYHNGLYLDAYKKCVPLVNYHDADITEATFIIKCTIMLKKWAVTEKLASIFLFRVKDAMFGMALRKYLFLSLARQQKWKQAVSVANEIPLETLDIHEQAVFAECLIEADEPVDNILQNLQQTEYYVQLQAQHLLKTQKYEDMIILLQNFADNALNVFYLGKAYWELKQYDNCQINLLKAAKLNPDHAETFHYLGHYYYHFKNDIAKAKKCYVKAYNLNNSDNNISKSLSNTYLKLKQRDADFELLNALVKNVSSNETWIYFRLGLHYLTKREWENAIINFRNVIKINHNDTTAFECLADAYYSRGSYTSALRAYNRVMTLDPRRATYCLTRIGYIYSLLTQYNEAISTFEKVFTIDPYSFLALKGISETWMRIAWKKLSTKMYGSARDCAQQAIDNISKALSKQNQFSCFWKLLADSLIFITKLPNKNSYVYITQLSKDVCCSEVTKKENLDIFLYAIACYSYITKQKQQVASYDLASAYFAYYIKSGKIIDCHISFNLVLNCIKEKPTLWQNWNLLGKICSLIKRYDIAQHCYIKALGTTRKWSVAKIWCNLGTLYLKLKLYKLANYCFWRGQSTMPSYPQSWIGQGLIAEVIREEESMDLFRHAARLGYHPESALGYADWVCRTLKNSKYQEDVEFKYVIEGLYAIPYAMDLVEWLCNYEPQNACAFTILGILQEQSGLLKAALKSYEKALQYVEEDKINIALLNMGRILTRTGNYDESVKTYKAVTEASLNSATGLALALFKKGLYEEAYSAYDTALHWLSNNDDEKADLLVALAGTVYNFKGADDAKTLLFHSIQVSQKKPTANSLFAICSLGLLQSDKSLSKLALGELRKYERDNNFQFDIGFLKSYIFVCEENIEHATKLLSDSLHDHPSNSLLWFCMAQYCLINSSPKAKIASGCAQKALCSSHYRGHVCNFAKIMATASLAEYIAGDHLKSLSLAKEGLHMYPNQAEIWATLVRSLLSHRMWVERKPWILAATEHMRRHLNISRRLGRWVNLMEKKLTR